MAEIILTVLFIWVVVVIINHKIYSVSSKPESEPRIKIDPEKLEKLEAWEVVFGSDSDQYRRLKAELIQEASNG